MKRGDEGMKKDKKAQDYSEKDKLSFSFPDYNALDFVKSVSKKMNIPIDESSIRNRESGIVGSVGDPPIRYIRLIFSEDDYFCKMIIKCEEDIRDEIRALLLKLNERSEKREYIPHKII